MRQLPEYTEKIRTGVVKFGNDEGVFIESSEAKYNAKIIRASAEAIAETDKSKLFVMQQLAKFADLLEGKA